MTPLITISRNELQGMINHAVREGLRAIREENKVKSLKNTCSIAETAKILNCSRWKVNDMIASGILKVGKLGNGRKTLITNDSIQQAQNIDR